MLEIPSPLHPPQCCGVLGWDSDPSVVSCGGQTHGLACGAQGLPGSSAPCCTTALEEVESCPFQSPGSLSVLAGRDIPHGGPQAWPWLQPPTLLPGLHVNPAVPGLDPFPLLSCACAPGVHLSICASSGASAANKRVGAAAAAVQQPEGHGEGTGGVGGGSLQTQPRPPHASTTTAIKNQPRLFCTAEYKLNVSDSTAPSPLPAPGGTVGMEESTSTAPR